MTKIVYKVWLDIEECELDEHGEIVASRLVDAPEGPVDTFETIEEAWELCKKMYKQYA